MASIPNMFELLAPVSRKPVPFAGADFDPKRDRARLTRQIDCICYVAVNGGRQWWTVQDLAKACSQRFPWLRFPETSVQAQLRNLRKVGYTVERRNIAKVGVLYEYMAIPPQVRVEASSAI